MEITLEDFYVEIEKINGKTNATRANKRGIAYKMMDCLINKKSLLSLPDLLTRWYCLCKNWTIV
ncbi:MAG TPA: hypothetical protein PLF38_05795 [Xylanibacter oryzae]|nr:hypothetical protein [Xylanibacter oryzae]